MRPTWILSTLAAITSVGMLAACGFGGNAVDGAMSGAQVGVLRAGGPVEGVAYLSATQRGITGADGSFRYRHGEQITFSLGATPLGDPVDAMPEMSPVDLVRGAIVPTTGSEVRSFVDEFAQRVPGYFDARSNTQKQRVKSIIRLSNLMVLLGSFDQDRDPSNGIQVHADAALVLATRTLDLSDDFARFQQRMRVSMYTAWRAGALTSPREVRWGQALDAYAAVRGVTPQVFDFETNSSDFDNNGTPDYIQRYTHDTSGRRLLESTDFDANGTQDFIRGFEHDAFGDIVREFDDRDADQTIDNNATNEYDKHGNRTRRTGRLESGLGGPDTVWTWTYDELGNLTQSLQDRLGNGTNVSRESFTHDERGNVTKSIVSEGTERHSRSTTYDDRDNWVRRVSDRGDDGTEDSVHLRSYDAAGRLTREADDYNADQVIDRVRTLTYDDAGNLLREDFEFQNNGEVTASIVRQYDAQGNMTREENIGRGVTYRTVTTTYDADGRMTSNSQANRQDEGTAVNEARASYRADGLLDHLEHVSTRSSTSRTRFQYDAHGNVVGTVRTDSASVRTTTATFRRVSFAARALQYDIQRRRTQRIP